MNPDELLASAPPYPERIVCLTEETTEILYSIGAGDRVVGGEDICVESRSQQGAQGRIYDPAEIARRTPEIIVASWCGRRVEKDKIRARPGWESVPAVVHDRIHEIDSTIFLQPGPAALTDGIEELARVVHAAAQEQS